MCEHWSPFLDKILGLDIGKLLGITTYDALTMKIKLERNKAFLEVTNGPT